MCSIVRAKAFQKPKVLGMLRALVADAFAAPLPRRLRAHVREGAVLDDPILALDGHRFEASTGEEQWPPSCSDGFEGNRNHAYDNQVCPKSVNPLLNHYTCIESAVMQSLMSPSRTWNPSGNRFRCDAKTTYSARSFIINNRGDEKPSETSLKQAKQHS